MKNNIDLVAYAKAQLGKPYWFGTFGQITTEKLWNDKAKQYPKYYSDLRKKKAIPAQLNKKAHDCAGLIKGYLWSDSADAPAKYNSAQDYSADAFYNKSTNKGTIDTIPEVVGLAVWRKGHIGVYIGGGKVVEAKGFDYGVVESNLKGSTFTHWLYIPFIEYKLTSEVNNVVTSPVKAEEKPTASASGVYTVKKGDTLTKVAKAHGVTVNSIVKANSISDPNLIKVGQKLIIDAKAPVTNVTKYKVCVNTKLNVRRTPKIDNYNIIGKLSNGDVVEVVSVSGGWAKLNNDKGYVSETYLRKI